MKVHPIKWAKAIADNLGPKEARRIAAAHKVERLGDDRSVPNPHSKFYRVAWSWLNKNYPETENA